MLIGNSLQHIGLHQQATIGNGGKSAGDLKRSDGNALPKRNRSEVNVFPNPRRTHEPRNLSRQIHTGHDAEAEVFNRRSEAFPAEHARDFGRSDVTRLGDYVGEGDGTLTMGVMNDPPSNRVTAVLTSDQRLRSNDARIECRCGHESFECRTGLVRIRQSTVAPLRR